MVSPDTEMAKNLLHALAMVRVICYFFSNVNAFTASGWTKAHATFYGGSDASGTMGKWLFHALYIYYFYASGTIA